jgi:hypothetical protein
VKEDINSLEFYKKADPDDHYDVRSITFIYDNETDTLYSKKYPSTHPDVLNGIYDEKTGRVITRDDDNDFGSFLANEKNKRVCQILGIPIGSSRDRAIDKGYILGRIGNKGQIGFWNKYIEPEDIYPCLAALVDEYGDMVNANSPVFAAYDYDTAKRAFEPFRLGEAQLPARTNSKRTQKPIENDETDSSPQCKQFAQIVVDGKPMDFSQILSSLHMVRGNEIERIKAAYCSAAPQIKQQLQKQDCKGQAKLADTIWNRLKCNDQQTWNQLKKAGRRVQRDNLRDTFRKGTEFSKSGEDYLGSQFRTQKDLDAAWDDLMHGKHEHKLNFKKWLQESHSENIHGK